MKHYGDITQISGKDVPVVNVVIGGSPCQDLSIAGKRAGLDGERSGLFMEQIRIIMEMREKDAGTGRTDDDIRPRFMVWENVPGAFSSNKGEDFRTVLEETAKIADKNAVIPRPPKGKWTTSGCIMGDGWSIAWRVLDAQFWGVPQRRRRIALVADFGGQSAPEILFERDSVSGDIAESGAARKRAAGDAEIGTGNTGKIVIPINTMIATRCEQLGERTGLGIGKVGDSAFTISRSHSNAFFCLQGNGIDRADTAGCNGSGWKEDVSYTLNTVDRHAVYDARGNGDGATAPTLTGDHQNRVTDYTAVVCEKLFANQQFGGYKESETASTCRLSHSADKFDLVCKTSVVRLLTPLECERLQGFPDGWTDIGDWVDNKGKRRTTSDSARYKALGNSIALPPWFWVLSRLSTYCTEKTMASLFDGIGGFPLIWETLNGKGSAVWCSEIEEFPIAVTKIRFPE